MKETWEINLRIYNAPGNKIYGGAWGWWEREGGNEEVIEGGKEGK